jgi:hypothetical protein
MKIPFGLSRSRRGVVSVLSGRFTVNSLFLATKTKKHIVFSVTRGASKEYNKNARFRAMKAVLIKYFLYAVIYKCCCFGGKSFMK